MSLGSYSPSNPTLWIETTAIKNGYITTSNNITTGVNIYATDGLIKGKNLKITSTSSFTGAMTAQTVNLSSITYNHSSGLDKLTIKGGTTLEFRDKEFFDLVNVSANADNGFCMHRHLLINSYDIGGGRHIGANNECYAISNIMATNKFMIFLIIASTSTCTGDISALKYTKTEVNQLLS